jgi:F-type H+-transporting ATPase subunit a
MPEQLWFTAILNHLFAGPVTALLLRIGITPKHPDAPISNSFAMELLVFFFLLAVFLMLRSRLSVDSPGGLQHTFEGIEGFVLALFRHRLYFYFGLQPNRTDPGL